MTWCVWLLWYVSRLINTIVDGRDETTTVDTREVSAVGVGACASCCQAGVGAFPIQERAIATGSTWSTFGIVRTPKRATPPCKVWDFKKKTDPNGNNFPKCHVVLF